MSLHDETELLQRLTLAAEDAYGQLHDPRFNFVSRALAKMPYKDLQAEVEAAGFALTDTTDSNDDVAWHWYVERDGAGFSVIISMAGPFACIRPDNTAGAADIAALLEAHDLTIIPEAMLSQRILLKIEGAPTTIAQAFFASH